MSLSRVAGVALALFICTGASRVSLAAQFPAKPVRLVTPYPPGGGTDAVARPIAASFSKAWGQPVVVDNRGGGGGVTFSFCNFPAARPHLNSGRLKAIATTGAKRTALMPQAPTMIESGLPGFEYTTWYGFYFPARTPRAIIDFVNAELRRALADHSIAEPLLVQGAEASPSSPEALTRLMRDESARWMKVIKSQNLKF